MKKLLTTFIILMSLGLYSQQQISISAMQDAKLAFIGDDKGNDAFTYNGNYRLNLELKQQNLGYWYTGIGYENAHLKGGNYERYYFFVGYTLNNIKLGGKLDYLDASIDFNYGLTQRFDAGFSTRGISGELSYPITKSIDILARGQFVQRPDIDYHPELTGKNYTGVVRFSGFIGLRLDISFLNLI